MFTLMVAGSAMFLSRSRRSRVRRGKLSHKPTTTRSMSLKQGNYISLTVQLLSNHLSTLLLKNILENIFDVLLLVHLYLLQSVKCSVSSHILFVCPNSISLITVEIINQPPISKVFYSLLEFHSSYGRGSVTRHFRNHAIAKKRAMLTFSGGVDKVFKDQPKV